MYFFYCEYIQIKKIQSQAIDEGQWWGNMHYGTCTCHYSLYWSRIL